MKSGSWARSGPKGCWAYSGAGLWELANGIDPTGVNPAHDVKSISHEVTLSQDTSDRELIEAHMLAMSQKVCRRLRRKGLCAGTHKH